MCKAEYCCRKISVFDAWVSSQVFTDKTPDRNGLRDADFENFNLFSPAENDNMALSYKRKTRISGSLRTALDNAIVHLYSSILQRFRTYDKHTYCFIPYEMTLNMEGNSAVQGNLQDLLNRAIACYPSIHQ
jgi:hypothetical protein